ncbi:hypothetical protein Pcinc_031394 [Petrolisthes cinctipes]|uniref:Beta-sarcoglycan n=1 Tax=Petrolisthes cinctipes TaxID=88211 RepID=A0AAE1EQJ0_PETCI|nr:hypothetical protein Pcinc_034309 [Petrolisthes cinctipes]KAK3862772.1 hypothetical protein Pcinc_031394 [Petrolisthes cinctipes]
MGDSAAASLLAESASLAPSTLERATLTGRSTTHTTSVERDVPSKRAETSNGESTFFWGLVVVLLLLALGNLLLTFFAMRVLRLGYGMESIELIPGKRVTKFYGRTDLGNIYKRDGLIYSYADTPFSIRGNNSKVSLSLRTSNKPPVLEVGPKTTEINSVDSFQVVEPDTGHTVFSTDYPNFGLPQGVKNLNVSHSRTARVTSPTYSDLKIHSDSTIRLKGNEGLTLDGGKMTWSADQDIYLRSINGSILLKSEGGIIIDVNSIPLVPTTDTTTPRGQYKLCMCMPQGQLFRVPVPTDNNKRNPADQINCASFTNPCAKE